MKYEYECERANEVLNFSSSLEFTFKNKLLGFYEKEYNIKEKYTEWP